jgi:uncharacterized membrane protein YvbJ
MLKATAYLCLTFGLYSHYSFAAVTEFHVQIKNHLFFPSTIAVPPRQKVKLVIHNQDDTPEEFDSFSLNREKVIFANSKATIFIGPLLPGEYSFFGEYHPNTAQGVVLVKDLKQENTDVN